MANFLILKGMLSLEDVLVCEQKVGGRDKTILKYLYYRTNADVPQAWLTRMFFV